VGAIDIRVATDNVAVRMLGDDPDFSSGQGPGSVDPTQPLVLLAQQLREATSLTFDDPEQFVDDLVQELLDMPPEQRFEEGITVLRDHFVEEFGSVDAFEAQFPLASAVLFAFLEQTLNQWGEEIAENALESSRGEWNSLPIVLAAVDVMQDAMNGIQAGMQSQDDTEESDFPPLELTEGEKYRLGSVLIAIYARLYREIKRGQNGEMPQFSVLAKDVLYGEKTLIAVFDPEAEYPEIEDMTDQESIALASRRGALRVYEETDISIGRGAEIARMTQNEFVELLEENNIRPNYGPESVDDLHSGPDLTNE
jgi:hypothetical protein